MADLSADLDRIREFSRALGRIHGQFTGRANPADGYGKSELGSSELLGAFDDFGSNWKIHRRKLAEKVEKLAKITEAAAKTFEEIDHQLAEALRKQDREHAGKKADK